ncbi:YybH family protein [Pseudaquabacterium rugosum]|uniref:SgcJ/EcaC family oxidoreductase n=1 Tax=Pseudaquabacterium rugosum TaxID=2984194 RepID=A0ABU9BE13_9BURK
MSISRHAHRAMAAALMALTAVHGTAQAAAPTPEQAIRQTLTRYESALRAGDTPAIVKLYTADGVQMAPDAPAAVGHRAVQAAYDGTFKAITLDLRFDVDELRLLAPDAAVLRTHSAGTVQVNGRPQTAGPAAFKELFLLKRQADGQWLFTHYSFSTAPVQP